jgi:hypothetical protein
MMAADRSQARIDHIFIWHDLEALMPFFTQPEADHPALAAVIHLNQTLRVCQNPT